MSCPPPRAGVNWSHQGLTLNDLRNVRIVPTADGNRNSHLGRWEMKGINVLSGEWKRGCHSRPECGMLRSRCMTLDFT